MTVALRSVGQSAGADSTSCVIVKPVGLAVGDLMIAQVVGTSTGAIPTTFTSPAGWTGIRQDVGGTAYVESIRTALFWKIADATDVAATNFTFTATGAASNRGTITAWTGHDPTTPINANNGQGNTYSITVTSPTITPSVANCMILLFCGICDNDTQSGYAIVTSNPASWSEAYDLPSNLACDLGLSLGYALRPETSATGNGTATTSASDVNTGQLVAIAPAAAVALSAVSAGVCTVSAALAVAHSLSAVSAGVASVSGALRVAHSLSAAIAGIATVTANLTNTKWLRAVITGEATVSGFLRVARALSAVSAGVASVSGTIRVLRGLSATITCSSTVTASLFHVRHSVRNLLAIRNLPAVRNLPPVR
jgi:hypothetical protein